MDSPPPKAGRWRRLGAAAVWVVLGLGLWLFSAGPRDMGGDALIGWHPLILPFRAGVERTSGAWLQTGALWVQVAVTLVLAGSLRPRRWGVVVTACLVLLSPTFGLMFPAAYRWALLGLALALRLRGWQAACGLVVAGSVLMDTAFGMSIFVRYGFSQASDPWLHLMILLPTAAAAVAILRGGRRWLPALPLLFATAVFALVAVFADQFTAHREGAVPPEDCQDLGVEILDPLEPQAGAAGAFLPRGIAEAEDGTLAVSGEGVILVYAPDGTPLRRLDRVQALGRIEFVLWDGDTLLAAPSNGAVRWPRGGQGDPEISQWDTGFPEILQPLVVGRRRFWSTVDYPVLLVDDPPHPVYLGGTVGLAAFLREVDGRLFVGDAYGLYELDPKTLEILQRRGYPLMSSRTNSSRRYLFRMEAIQGFVRVIDPDGLGEVARFRPPFTPRYAAVADDAGVMALTDYFGGMLWLYDTATWRPIRSMKVGRRPRNLLWSPRQDAFLGVSGCGLYRVPLDDSEAR